MDKTLNEKLRVVANAATQMLNAAAAVDAELAKDGLTLNLARVDRFAGIQREWEGRLSEALVLLEAHESATSNGYKLSDDSGRGARGLQDGRGSARGVRSSAGLGASDERGAGGDARAKDATALGCASDAEATVREDRQASTNGKAKDGHPAGGMTGPAGRGGRDKAGRAENTDDGRKAERRCARRAGPARNEPRLTDAS